MADLVDGQGALSLVIDLSELELIDSSGLAVLVDALKRIATLWSEPAKRLRPSPSRP